MRERADEILTFWFGALDAGGWADEARNALWFGARREDDEVMRARFGALIDAAIDGELAAWAEDSDATNMALLLLADQMTRAVHRGTARAFAGDAVALAVCKQGVADGRHKRLPPAWRRFYYLPLEHSESLADQRQCVALYEEMQRDYPDVDLQATVFYAVEHLRLIERFGRFPHRNAVLGRDSTAEEVRHLAEGGPRFGQSAGK